MATQLIQRVLPSLDFPILSYINGIFGPDADPNDNPVESFIRPLLESETRPVVPQDEIDRVCAELQAMWDKITGGVGAAGGAAGPDGGGGGGGGGGVGDRGGGRRAGETRCCARHAQAGAQEQEAGRHPGRRHCLGRESRFDCLARSQTPEG